MMDERIEHEVDEEQLKLDIFNNIKKLKFDKHVYAWYLINRRNMDDVILYRDIMEGRNLSKNYKKVINNIKKTGNPNMSYNSLIDLYISKRFNRDILKPMCKAAFKKNYELVLNLARL